MSSDGRYMYHHAQGISPTYDYSSYPPPPPSYDNAQVPQAPLRPVRSNSSSQPHSPHQPPQFNPPQPPYPPNYGPGPYMPQPPQWTGENWTHYNQSFPPTAPPPPPPPESPFSSGQSRPEAVPSSSAETRPYPPISANSDPRRVDERQGSLSNAQTPPKGRRREKESPSSAVSPSSPSGLDFMKLLESYRSIIDASEALSNGAHGRPPAETMERMLQSATYGAQMLESATQQKPIPSAAPRSPVQKEPEDTKEATNGTATSSKRQKGDDSVQEGQTCLGCNATSTPEWRRGPMGPRTLCNACGLVYAKLIKKRVREGGRASGKSNGQGGAGLDDDPGFASTGEGDSEDDDDYGSQDRRSELGDGGRD